MLQSEMSPLGEKDKEKMNVDDKGKTVSERNEVILSQLLTLTQQTQQTFKATLMDHGARLAKLEFCQAHTEKKEPF